MPTARPHPTPARITNEMKSIVTQTAGQTKPHRKLGIMAKYWLPGLVKSRLGRDTGLATAAAIHKCFVVRLVENLEDVAEQRCIFASPDDACPDFEAEVGVHWTVCPQGDGGLGARMERAFKSLLEASNDGVAPLAILIGADLPTLAPQDLEVAFDKLSAHDVVLGPAEDGGYYLIGLRGPWRDEYASLFQSIPWSTRQVLEQTVHVIRLQGLSHSLLATREDIDTIDELNRLLSSPVTDFELTKAIHALLAERN